MRTARRLTMSCLQAAIGLAAVVAVVPASFAQNPPVPGHGKSAGAQEISDGLRLEGGEHAGVFVEVPIGRVWVDPDLVEGEPSYVRRTKATVGMTIVEVSTTPFMEAPPGLGALIGRPDEQPASW